VKLPPGLTRNLEAAINRYLRLDPGIGARMQALNGRSIGLEFRGLELQLFVLPGEHGIRLLDRIDSEPDTVLRGTPLGIARLGLGGSSEKTLFSGAVEILGDVETGQLFKSILDAMEIDWEEQLSHLTGDVIAHQLGNAARRTHKLFKRTRMTLERDTGEYLQEELRILPARIEIENFSDDVNGLRMSVDRLAARVTRLQAAANNKQDKT
jgi:ubiquinone biosynthesis protein UbiJ